MSGFPSSTAFKLLGVSALGFGLFGFGYFLISSLMKPGTNGTNGTDPNSSWTGVGEEGWARGAGDDTFGFGPGVQGGGGGYQAEPVSGTSGYVSAVWAALTCKWGALIIHYTNAYKRRDRIWLAHFGTADVA
jgi:hypothetical protein